MPSLSPAAVNSSQINEKDIYLGEVAYYAYQGKYLDAITRFNLGFGNYYGIDKSGPDPLHLQFRDGQLSLGDIESSYGMTLRAASVFKPILESNASQSVRNEAAYALARISMQRGELVEAQQYVVRITGKLPDNIRDDLPYLRAQLYLSSGKFSDAVQPLKELLSTAEYKSFATYNLGVALIKSGQEKLGLEQIERAAQLSGSDDVTLSIMDKANLMLGYRLLDSKQPALAKPYLNRVRLNSPFSNKALLGLGWADIALGNFENAIVPWSVLTKRKLSDQFVQEGMLGVPYAYAKLNLPGKAALLYDRALDGFEQELDNLDALTRSVREGRFFPALSRKEFKQGKDWVVKISLLPETPETVYVRELMVADDFQTLLGGYLDIGELSKQLKSWDEDPDSLLARLGRGVTQSGYDDQIRQLKGRISNSRQKIDDLMALQDGALKVMASNDLVQRRARLLAYQSQARLAEAKSYDRATKAQSPVSGVK